MYSEVLVTVETRGGGIKQMAQKATKETKEESVRFTNLKQPQDMLTRKEREKTEVTGRPDKKRGVDRGAEIVANVDRLQVDVRNDVGNRGQQLARRLKNNVRKVPFPFPVSSPKKEKHRRHVPNGPKPVQEGWCVRRTDRLEAFRPRAPTKILPQRPA